MYYHINTVTRVRYNEALQEEVAFKPTVGQLNLFSLESTAQTYPQIIQPVVEEALEKEFVAYYTKVYESLAASPHLSEATRTQHNTTLTRYVTQLELLNKPEAWSTFRIPKATGGFRTITAPNEALKATMVEIVNYFQYTLHMYTHNAAHAYVKNRTIVDALNKHQKNNSKWFLKIDLKEFFPSCTEETVYNTLSKLYPLYDLDQTLLKRLIKGISLNGHLPQGAPTSPLFSNLTMIPYDYAITKLLNKAEHINLQKYVYTRYADDILISAKSNFNKDILINKLTNTLNPFIIKSEKTRYGNRSGRNWNLGLMLNKDNNITLGHEKKKQLKSMIFNFMLKSDTEISKEEAYAIQGQLNWFKQIEPAYATYIIKKYDMQFQNSIIEKLKRIIKR